MLLKQFLLVNLYDIMHATLLINSSIQKSIEYKILLFFDYLITWRNNLWTKHILSSFRINLIVRNFSFELKLNSLQLWIVFSFVVVAQSVFFVWSIIDIYMSLGDNIIMVISRIILLKSIGVIAALLSRVQHYMVGIHIHTHKKRLWKYHTHISIHLFSHNKTIFSNFVLRIFQLIQHQNLKILVPTPHNTMVIVWG